MQCDHSVICFITKLYRGHLSSMMEVRGYKRKKINKEMLLGQEGELSFTGLGRKFRVLHSS